VREQEREMEKEKEKEIDREMECTDLREMRPRLLSK
jgi:hypothetical protein